MAKFLTGTDLNNELGKIFEDAQEQLILISPFIKLHVHYESILKSKKNNPRLAIILVFGKNENEVHKSMRYEDLNFFKDFPNIQIRYEKRLHAKYYSNEKSSILTSMNLYSFSQDNNIEAGVLTKATLIGNIASNLFMEEDSLDIQTSKAFKRIVEQSELIYHNVPQFDKGIVGTGFNKKYLKSNPEVDILSKFFSSKMQEVDSFKETKVKSNFRSTLNSEEAAIGYCIRTGKRIPLNDKQPMCDEAYQSWVKFGNKDYEEKYCHFSGEESFGETTYAKPIMRKNWKKANEIISNTIR